MLFDYPLLDPPFPVKETREMTPDEAQRHFDWFVAQAPARIDLLRRAIEATRGSASFYDFSVHSLVPVWAWAIPYLRTQHGRSANPSSGSPVPELPGDDFDTPTKCLVLDVAFYLAEILVRRDPAIRWTLWTDPDGPFNEAYLSGFNSPLVPKDIVSSCAWEAVSGAGVESCVKATADIWWHEARHRS
jgi:hypothetical protein